MCSFPTVSLARSSLVVSTNDDGVCTDLDCAEMREDLKGQNLTFTEIAKLVGENWQSLDPAEKEAYESQANRAKEQYHRSLAEYKKTPEYRKYSQYLQDFKEKQMKQKKGSYMSSPAVDTWIELTAAAAAGVLKVTMPRSDPSWSRPGCGMAARAAARLPAAWYRVGPGVAAAARDSREASLRQVGKRGSTRLRQWPDHSILPRRRRRRSTTASTTLARHRDRLILTRKARESSSMAILIASLPGRTGPGPIISNCRRSPTCSTTGNGV